MQLYGQALLCLSLGASLSLCGCGVVTPNIQEVWGNENDAGAMESAVANEIECELAQVVTQTYRTIHSGRTPAEVKELQNKYGYIFDWNAQTILTFVADEQSTLNPTPSWTSKLHPLSKSGTFTLGLTGTYRNQATRTDKVTLNYRLKDFLQQSNPACDSKVFHKGSLFIQSDLKIGEWLRQALDIAVSQSPLPNPPQFPKKVDAISHDVKFDILSSGGVATTWKLVEFGTGSNSLVSAQRDRSQDLLLTMGPPDKANPDQLGPAGQISVISSQLGNAVNLIGRNPL